MSLILPVVVSPEGTIAQTTKAGIGYQVKTVAASRSNGSDSGTRAHDRVSSGLGMSGVVAADPERLRSLSKETALPLVGPDNFRTGDRTLSSIPDAPLSRASSTRTPIWNSPSFTAFSITCRSRTGSPGWYA